MLAVLTGNDYVADGHIGMSHHPNPADANDIRIPTFTPTSERKILDELELPLAVERVRYVGEAVAMVVAESLVAARDAAEAVAVEYDVLPAVSDVEEALADGAPTLVGGRRTISRSTTRSATAPRSRRALRVRISWSSR